jgi:chaperonin GroES
MSFQALEDKVIIKVAIVEEKTESGLFIPDTATAVPDTGIVVAVGPGRTSSTGVLIPPSVKVGDTVIFEQRAAQRLEIEEQEYLVFLNDHILAIVED